MTGALYMGKCHHNYFMNCSWSFCLYAALMTWSLLFTEGLVNAWRALNSRTAPVLSNFFLKRLSALSIDSFSLMLIMIIAVHLLSGSKCTANLFNSKAKLKMSPFKTKKPNNTVGLFLKRGLKISLRLSQPRLLWYFALLLPPHLLLVVTAFLLLWWKKQTLCPRQIQWVRDWLVLEMHPKPQER